LSGAVEGATIPSNHVTVTFILPPLIAKLYQLAAGFRYPRWMIQLGQPASPAAVLLRCTTTVLHGKPDPVLILARGRVMEDGMGTLVFICPANGEEVSTGIEMDLATLNQLDLAKVFCPHCRQPHRMVGVEFWLSQVDEPVRLEETAEAA
jgi:hypothetical protein